MVEATLDAIPGVRNGPGRPRCRPKKLYMDKAYRGRRIKAECHRRGIIARVARIGIESKERLGRNRWVVERTIAWLHKFRRLAVRFDKAADVHLAFLKLATCVICYRYVEKFC